MNCAICGEVMRNAVHASPVGDVHPSCYRIAVAEMIEHMGRMRDAEFTGRRECE